MGWQQILRLDDVGDVIFQDPGCDRPVLRSALIWHQNSLFSLLALFGVAVK